MNKELGSRLRKAYGETKRQNICLLGVSFDTGNLGVSALAWSSIKLILRLWPVANVFLIGSGRQPGVYSFANEGRMVNICLRPVRYTPRFWVRDHILWMGLMLWFFRVFPFLKNFLVRRNTTLAALMGGDVVCDITGGDSFSDIYGWRRLIQGYMLKRVCQIMGRPFIMLPQTYGPFKSLLAKTLARRILQRADKIYSRDQEGLVVVEALIGASDKMELCPDVAFVLEAIRPENEQVRQIERLKDDGCQLIGLNISGLLYNGGYTKDNMFGLMCDYPTLVKNTVLHFARQAGHFVVLIPHVIPKDFAVENDLVACQAIWQSLLPAERERVMVLDGDYDQNQIKYLIGLCEFFMGARMHATIAAISQCVPAVGMAYSRKFSGVFQTAGVENCVVDLRRMNESEILNCIKILYQARDITRRQLAETIPEVKRQVLKIFESLSGFFVKI